MNNERAELAETFSLLESEELLRRFQSGLLTDLARTLVQEELARRGVSFPTLTDTEGDADVHAASGRDLFTVARYFIPTDAHIVQGCLMAAGVPAVVADANLVQTNSLLTSALGGVRILVPASYLQQAREVIAAFNRGEFRLEDDIDVGEP